MSIATAKSLPLTPVRWNLWLGLSLAASLVACLYAPLATTLIDAWSTDDNYTHGPLVVLAAVGLAVHALRRRAGGVSPPFLSTSRRDHAFGIAMAAVALLLHGVAWLLGFILLDVVSLVSLLLAGALTLGGRSLRRDLGLPILLLLFAAPLPVAWYQPLALGLQKIVSSLAATIFALGGLSVHREGYVIHLSGMSLEVGAACSGMRQLTAYLALGAVIGHLARRAIGTVGLLAAAVVLARLQDRWRHSIPHAPRDDSYVTDQPHSCLAPPHCGKKSRAGYLLLLTLVGAAVFMQLAAQRAVDAYPAPRAAELVAALDTLPRQLGPWHGIDAAAPKDIAWADQHLRRDYRHRETGQVVVVWIAYSHVGADRAHHPEICMDVAGRSEDRRRRREFTLPDGPPIAEFVFGSPGDALTAWYWHYAFPDVRSPNSNLLAQTYHRARSRRASMTVELLSSDDNPSGRDAARDLVSRIDTALRPMLPPGAVRGSSRLPVGVTAANETNGTDGTNGGVGRIRPLSPISKI
ncbi:MAG: exosortase-associated EpsI family protein [Planctomycetes bacterium]|nr:exosortase-associated EpsI family protein [Planctomycetota bacterium]